MLNEVLLVGRLGQKPELKLTAKGTPMAVLSVATNEFREEGEKLQKDTQWHRVVCWGKLAETVVEHGDKGTLVFVRGKLRYEKYTDRTGTKRESTSIVADKVQFPARRESEEHEAVPGEPIPSAPIVAESPVPDAELPF
jgi:single-strand DNA-binding protein